MASTRNRNLPCLRDSQAMHPMPASASGVDSEAVAWPPSKSLTSSTTKTLSTLSKRGSERSSLRRRVRLRVVLAVTVTVLPLLVALYYLSHWLFVGIRLGDGSLRLSASSGLAGSEPGPANLNLVPNRPGESSSRDSEDSGPLPAPEQLQAEAPLAVLASPTRSPQAASLLGGLVNPWQAQESPQAASVPSGRAEPGASTSPPPALPPCPAFLSSITEDLEPWRRRGGISRESLLNARQAGASLRIVIAGGKLFAEELQPNYVTRALFSLWGLLELLRLYPGDIPDVELMLNCDDWPRVSKAEHALAAHPPLLLKFCSTPDHMDVPWPDWSFWGWPEVGLRHWGSTGRSIAQAGARLPWGERRRVVQWKGTVWVARELRGPVVQCRDQPMEGGGETAPGLVDTSDTQWLREYNRSSTRLEGQCGARYKLYVEGSAWSCSLKYILACGATPVFVAPRYYDFFTRALLPGVHYIPVPTPASFNSTAQFCQVLRGVVAGGPQEQEEPCKRAEKGLEGNSHNVASMGPGSAASAAVETSAGAGACQNRTAEHERIAQEVSHFISKVLTMRHVYEFMRHFLVEYHRLQRFDALLVPRHGMQLVTEETLREHARNRSLAGEFTLDYLEYLKYLEQVDPDSGSSACEMNL